jgi:hypothetical protein
MSAFVEFFAYFLIACVAVAAACSCIRARPLEAMFKEAVHFFFLMVVGIVSFSAVVHVLEWVFSYRP